MVTPGFIPVLVPHISLVLAPVLVPHIALVLAPEQVAPTLMLVRSISLEPAPLLGAGPGPGLKPTGYKIGHASGIKDALGK